MHFYQADHEQENAVKLPYENLQLVAKDRNYWKLRDSVVQFELLVLRILEFNLTIELPHKFLIFYLKSLNDFLDDELIIEELFRLSWSLLNDYLCNHPGSIKWEGKQCALVCIELAFRIGAPNVKNLIENDQMKRKCWYFNFDNTLKQETVDEISEQILTVCTPPADIIHTEKNERATHLTT